jgi:AcrR family transcriptional regulator
VGYARTSLAEIARRAGVSKGVVSYYFAHKDELLQQLVVEVYTRAGQAIADRVEQETSAAAALRGYLQANLDFIAAHPAQIRAVAEIAVNLRRPDGTLHFAAGADDPVIGHLADLLRSGQRTEEFCTFDPTIVAMMIRAAIDAASGRLIADPSFDIDAYTRELITFVEQATTRKTP